MGYIFEFYNSSGEITKKGKLSESKIFMATTEDDYRYVIKKDEYPYSIEREGYFKKSQAGNQNESFGTLSSVKHDEIEFMLNKELAEVNYYINNQLASHKKRGALIVAPNTPGMHKIVNSTTQEETWFRVKNLKTLDAVNQLSDNAETENIVSQILIDYKESELTLPEVIIDALKESKNEQLLHHYRILSKFQTLYNEMIKSETGTKWRIDNYFECRVFPEDEINKVSIYELQRNQKFFKGSINVLNETKLVIDEYKPYLIEGYKDGIFVSSRLAISVPSNVRTAKWIEDKYNEERFNYLIQKARISSSGIPEEIEEEMFLISSAGIFSPRYGAPEITDNEEKIVFHFTDAHLAKEYGEMIYLCIATKKEFANKMYWLKQEIDSHEITVDIFDSGITREETYLVWIENHLGNKVSDFNILYPAEVFEDLNTIYFDHIVSKERALIVERVINAGKGQFEKLITDYYANSNELMNRRTRLEKLISELYEKGNWDIGYIVFDIIFDYLTKDDIKINNFFDESLKFSGWTRRIEIPPTQREFVAIMYSFDDYSQQVTKHIIQQPKYVDVGESYAIIQFFDLTTNVASNYAFISGRSISNPIRLSRGLEIEVI